MIELVITSTTRPKSGAAAIILTMREALDLLRRQSVGRVCVEVDGYPVAFPVNYVVDETVDGSRIVVRTAPTTPIGGFRGRASLEIDWFDLAAGRAWSVIVRGELHRLVGRKPNQDPHPFVSDERTQWMELTIVAVSGRRFVADSSGFTVEWQLEPTGGDRAISGSAGSTGSVGSTPRGSSLRPPRRSVNRSTASVR